MRFFVTVAVADLGKGLGRAIIPPLLATLGIAKDSMH